MAYVLRGPTFNENLWTRNRLFIRYRLPRGITLAVRDGQVEQLIYPYQEDLKAYDYVYLGGHEHTISDEEAAVLQAAGYGDYLTPVEA